MRSSSNNDHEAIAAWIGLVVARWADVGVSRSDQRRLRGDLEKDLLEALANGAPVASLTAEDPAAFADQVAVANDIPIAAQPQAAVATNRSLAATGLAGGALGAVVAWKFVYPLANRLPDFTAMPETAFAVLVHAVAATVVLLSSVAAIWWRFRDDKTIGRTIAFAGPLILVAGALSVAPTMAFASLVNFSFNPLVILVEFAIVGGFVSSAIVLARRLTTRSAQTLAE